MAAVDELQTNGLRDSPLDDDGTPDFDRGGGSAGEDDEDLFGDDNEDKLEDDDDDRKRTLDDPDLDSGDDLGRDDRVAATVEDGDQEEAPMLQTMDADIPRVNYPEGNEFYLLNLPPFLGVKQENFSLDTFEPQKLPHDGDPERQTSAYSTAMSSVFWRRDPLNPDKLQSNARIIRWSDGSLTLQLATKPQEQFRIATTAMRQDFGKKVPQNTPYDPSKDSLTFLAAAHSTPGIDLQLVRPIDAAMKILPSGGETHESVKRLQKSLAALKEDHDPLARLKEVKEDPELAKKAAEQFEKDRQRAQRKRENAEERLITRRDRVLGRSGMGGGRYGGAAGLSVAGLEDEMGMPISRGSQKKAKRRTNRYGEIYSDDEDDTMPRGRTREDEYDREDDFLAASDEEPEVYDDGEGEEELLDDDDDPDKDDLEIEGRETVLDNRTRGGRDNTPPKRMRMDEIEGDAADDDAEGEPDDEVLQLQQQQRQGSPGQARKKRRVIEDEDEE